MKVLLLLFIASAFATCSFSQQNVAQHSIRIPLGGNTFFSADDAPKGIQLGENGISHWEDSAVQPIVYVRTGQTGKFKLSIIAKNKSKLSISATGKTFTISTAGSEFKEYAAGTIKVTDTG